MSAKTFIDTNVLIYLLSNDSHKATTVERLLLRQPTISVQVLNEIIAVAGYRPHNQSLYNGFFAQRSVVRS